MNEADFQTFVDQYLGTALWSSTGEDGKPLDDSFTVDEISPAAVASATETCRDFVNANLADLKLVTENFPYDWSNAGHDFWLTRNGHGVGFWDRGLGEVGKRLTEAAKVYSSCDIYAGDDNLLYFQ